MSLSSGHLFFSAFYFALSASLRFVPVVLTSCYSVATADEPARLTAEVQTFLANHCVDCHGAEQPEAGLSLDRIELAFDSDDRIESWQRIAEKLALKQMPPEDSPQPSPETREMVVQWIGRELHKVDQPLEIAQKLARPEYGNYVDHAALFDPRNARPSASPPRLWRLNPYAYTEMAYDLSRQRSFAQPFAYAAGEGVKDYSALYQVDKPTAELLIRNAHAIADYQMVHSIDKDGKLKGSWRTPQEVLVLLDPQNKSPTREQFGAMIATQFELVHQRQPSKEEAARFLEFLENTVKKTGLHRGVKATLAAVMLMPEAVFRVEAGGGKPDEYGRVMLTPREISFALAFALTDDRPDNHLQKAVAEGRLSTRDEVAAEVDRMLADPKLAKPRILRFFIEYFGHHKAEDVFKDKEEFEYHRADVLVSDTDRLIETILAKDKNVLYELLTTRESFVNFTIDRKKGPQKMRPKDRVSFSYNVAKDGWSKEQPLRLPAAQRIGILTQPSWLVAHSLNTENHAILRGKWVRERLLGGTVPDLPITVDAQLPEDPDKTLRERMHVTTAKYCWQCHQKMNPIGLTFEMYDHFGRFREEELGKPVDATGAIIQSGSAELDGDYPNAVAMIEALAISEHVEQVFVRHAFRYFLGRNESVADAATLQSAHQAYRDSGGSMKALVKSLLTSDAFLYRFALVE